MTSRITDPDVLLWPRLSRFYGLSFSELRRMKRVFVRMYVEQMEEIEASEQLLALEASAYPHLEEGDQKAVFRQYQHTLREAAPEAPPVRRPLDEAAIAGLGIAVVREPPKVVAADA